MSTLNRVWLLYNSESISDVISDLEGLKWLALKLVKGTPLQLPVLDHQILSRTDSGTSNSQSEGKSLTFKEAAKYLDYSESHLYKLTGRKAIRYYHPGGKKIYFDRKDLDEFMHRGKVETFDNQLESLLIPRNRRHAGGRKAIPARSIHEGIRMSGT